MSDQLDRRTFLKSGAVVGAAGLSAGCGGSQSDGGDGQSGDQSGSGGGQKTSIGNFPVKGDTVTFGFTVPQSGPYQPEGEAELRGYKMAVRDLNNGRGWVGSSSYSDLSGNGLLGKEVDFVTADTATDPKTAKPAAKKLIEEDDVIMFTGGSSSAVALELQKLAQKQQVLYMACLTHANATTGSGCARYAFRVMFNAKMTAAALVPPLTTQVGTDIDFYQFYADYVWGQNLQSSIKDRFETQGWNQIESKATRLGRNDYRSDLENAAKEDPDVVFLNQFGLDGATIIRQADEIFDDDTELVLPLYDRPMAKLAGDSIDGVFGTVVWDTSVDTTLSIQFIDHFKNEFGRLPAGTAYLAYVVTMLYASSAARVGSFNPAKIIDDLEGRVYQSGLGEGRMRACDHQAMRPVPVARGLPPSEQTSGNYYEVISNVEKVPYDCDSPPASECKLGSVN